MRLSSVALSICTFLFSLLSFENKVMVNAMRDLNLRKKFIKHLQFMRINIGALKWLAIFVYKSAQPHSQHPKHCAHQQCISAYATSDKRHHQMCASTIHPSCYRTAQYRQLHMVLCANEARTN